MAGLPKVAEKRPGGIEGRDPPCKKSKGNTAAKANPVHVPSQQKYVLTSMCKNCMEDTWRRVKVMASGREFITFVLCPRCVQKNQVLTTLFK